MTQLFSIIDDFLAILFPRTCEICGNSLFKNEYLICTRCFGLLPYTNWHKDEKNPLHAVFWGKVNLNGVTAMLYFHPKNRVQKLLHKLKYKGVRELGVLMGKKYGLLLKNAQPYNSIDYIIPVPLHPDKFKSRGYNQSEEFAKGLSLSMNIPQLNNQLFRKIASSTQTKKTKIERWENVKDIFEIQDSSLLEEKHILLVDDVITTGSTLEACARVLLEVKGLELSVAAIGAAHR